MLNFADILPLKSILVPIGIIVLVVLLVAVIKRKLKAFDRPRARRIMSQREQRMYYVLQKALPEYIILSQVCFSALLTAKSYAVRARFNRKYTDFVVCDRSMNVIAIIELDDWSHQGKEDRDAERDKMLTLAGYLVLRYGEIPSHQTIRCDIYA